MGDIILPENVLAFLRMLSGPVQADWRISETAKQLLDEYDPKLQWQPGDIARDAEGSLFYRATSGNWIRLTGEYGYQPPSGKLVLLVRDGQAVTP